MPNAEKVILGKIRIEPNQHRTRIKVVSIPGLFTEFHPLTSDNKSQACFVVKRNVQLEEAGREAASIVVTTFNKLKLLGGDRLRQEVLIFEDDARRGNLSLEQLRAQVAEFAVALEEEGRYVLGAGEERRQISGAVTQLLEYALVDSSSGDEEMPRHSAEKPPGSFIAGLEEDISRLLSAVGLERQN